MKVLLDNFKSSEIQNSVNFKYCCIKPSFNLSFKGDEFVKNQDSFSYLKKAYGDLINECSTPKHYYSELDEIEALGKRSKRIIELNEQYNLLNELLNNSKAADYSEDERILANFLVAMSDLKDNKGFSRIAGYDSIKEKLTSEFVLKTIAKAKTSQNTDVPNAFLFFGPTGCGKTTFAQALAEQALCEADRVDIEAKSPGEVFQEIKDKAKKAKRNYEDSGKDKKRTILVVNEVDAIANKYSPVVNEFVEFMKDCAEKYKCTLFLTTNYPLDVDERILSKNITPTKVALAPADCPTTKAILEHRLKTMKKVMPELDSIAAALFSNPDKLYSNANIVSIINKTQKNIENPTTQDYIRTTKNDVAPSISRKSLARFNEEKKTLNAE